MGADWVKRYDIACQAEQKTSLALLNARQLFGQTFRVDGLTVTKWSTAADGEALLTAQSSADEAASVVRDLLLELIEK